MTLIVFGVPVALSLTFTPLVAEFRILPIVPVQSMVIDLVMVTAPKPPGSRQLISPPAAVLEIAPAKVLHGAVRLHGLSVVADAGDPGPRLSGSLIDDWKVRPPSRGRA